ncbi:Arm DNA-binding domain-containing protein [Edaphovirga cremea]|uniref:Arm DNA-binding domain-containing protein n=1 Tax=Edaphovirga cremea TaxID=2267246 RepID=UPI003988CB0A
MAKITIKELESLTVNDAGQILRENGNLAGRISVRKDGISVSFFYRYRWGDQNKEYACGTWPRKSLTDIRKARNQARALIDEQNGKISIRTGRPGSSQAKTSKAPVARNKTTMSSSLPSPCISFKTQNPDGRLRMVLSEQSG